MDDRSIFEVCLILWTCFCTDWSRPVSRSNFCRDRKVALL